MSSPTILPEPKPRGSPPRFLHSGLCALNDQAALKLGQYADMGRPVGVSVSMASVSDLNFTPRCFKSSSIVMRSRRLRPNLSSFHTMSVSPSCRALRQRVSAGRFVVAPEMPLSLWIVLHPARFKAVSYMAEFWSSVEYFMPAFWNNKTGLLQPLFSLVTTFVPKLTLYETCYGTYLYTNPAGQDDGDCNHGEVFARKAFFTVPARS